MGTKPEHAPAELWKSVRAKLTWRAEERTAIYPSLRIIGWVDGIRKNTYAARKILEVFFFYTKTDHLPTM